VGSEVIRIYSEKWKREYRWPLVCIPRYISRCIPRCTHHSKPHLSPHVGRTQSPPRITQAYYDGGGLMISCFMFYVLAPSCPTVQFRSEAQVSSELAPSATIDPDL
jgi:hypothetical protein